MEPIQVCSPTRVDLAGGTLDCWPLYAFLGDSYTVNMGINIYTYVDLRPRMDSVIEILSSDLDLSCTYSSLKECLSDSNPSLQWFRSHLNYWMPKKGFVLKTKSESPMGGGLGASSSLTIGLIKAFSQWLECPIDTNEMVHLAANIEAQILRTPTGTQDYFPAIEGGLNIISYKMNGVSRQIFSFPRKLISDKLLLVYTGRSHHSGLNNWEVLRSAIAGDPGVLDALRSIQEISLSTVNAIKANRWAKIGALLNREYHARVRLSEKILSPEILKLREISLGAGAEAIKICGAGGGGCVLIWCYEDERQKVAQRCQEAGFTVLDAHPV